MAEETTVIAIGSSQWTELMPSGGKQPVPAVEQRPEALAVLLFTAGSTGRPRAAMLTHRALLDNVAELLELNAPPAMTGDDIALGVLPLFHVYSLNSVARPVHGRGRHAGPGSALRRAPDAGTGPRLAASP